MAKQPTINYPYYKRLVWQFVRSGIAGGVATALTVTVVLQPDLSNYKPFVLALTSAFVAGFVGASGKAIRNYFNGGDKGAPIEKLPI